MFNLECVCTLCAGRGLFLLISSAFLMIPAIALSQTAEGHPYARTQTFGVFAAYSPNSSHILLGDTEKRKLLEFGVSYNRRLLVNHIVNWQYSGEFLPVVLEGDPGARELIQESSPQVATYTEPMGPLVNCHPQTSSYSFIDQTTGLTYSYTATSYCVGRQWSVGQAMSPAGFQWNFRPARKTQPFVTAHGGFMFSSQQIPVFGAGSFNFTFDIGAGVELFRSKSRSVRAEYRFHHISNDNTAAANPGIDNGLVQISYTFGH